MCEEHIEEIIPYHVQRHDKYYYMNSYIKEWNYINKYCGEYPIE